MHAQRCLGKSYPQGYSLVSYDCIFSLFAVGDISCDVGGSIEFLQHTTTIDKPFFSWSPVTDSVVDEIADETVAMMGIDILPTELSVESSKHFGDALVPLLEQLILNGYSTERADENLPPELVSDFVLVLFKCFLVPSVPKLIKTTQANACIARNGSLTPNYKYIEALMKRRAIIPLDDLKNRHILLRIKVSYPVASQSFSRAKI